MMAEDAYMGVYCRRWGVPLVDGGTVRLPRIIGQGRALEIIMTGRKVEAEECLRIGLCEKVVPKGQARQAAEQMADEIARFPQACVRADRHSVYLQQGLPVRAALESEWTNSIGVVEGAAGAARFAKGRRTARRFWQDLMAMPDGTRSFFKPWRVASSRPPFWASAIGAVGGRGRG
jgi:enoyl-CoA hydratase